MEEKTMEEKGTEYDQMEAKKPEDEARDEAIIEVEKSYATSQVVAKLRRLADALEAEKTFEIEIAGQRIYVPPYALVEFEYESTPDGEELEIELKWQRER